MATLGAILTWVILLGFLAIVALMIIATLAWMLRVTQWIYTSMAIGIREAIELCSGR